MSNSNKTLSMNIDGKEILVAELPKAIRDNVDLFDRVREDIDEISYNIAVLNHAAISLNNRILVDASAYFKAVKESEEEAKRKEEANAPAEKDVTPKSPKK